MDDYLQQGLAALNNGDTRKAIGLISLAVKQNPDSIEAWLSLSRVLDDPEKQKYCQERASRLAALKGVPLYPAATEQTPPAAKALIDSVPQPPSLRIDQGLPVETTGKSQDHRPALAYPIPPPNTPNVPAPVPPSESAPTPAAPSTRHRPVPKKKGNTWLWLAGAGAAILILCLAAGGIVWAYYTATKAPSSAALPVDRAPSPSQNAKLPSIYTPTHSPTPSPSPTFTITPTLDPTHLFEKLAPQITAAKLAIKEDRFEDAIPLYSTLLEALPNYAPGYYNRGLAYRLAAPKHHSLDEYQDYIWNAIHDFDSAIETGPFIGSYLLERGSAYWDLENTIEYRVDRQLLLGVTLENYQAGLAYGNYALHSETYLSNIYIQLGRCQEGVTEAQRLLEIWPDEGATTAKLREQLAEGYFCLGNFSRALQEINRAIEIQPSCNRTIVKTAILYSLRDLSAANQTITECIDQSPSFSGYRYYQRALIQYDLGNKDLARQDLEIGSGYTWYHCGIYAYLMGLFALDEGRTEEAAEWFQYAEATATQVEGPYLLNRIRMELTALGAPTLDPQPSIHLQTTPLPDNFYTSGPTRTPENPNFPAQPEPSNTPDPHRGLPPSYESALVYNIDAGLGKRTFDPGQADFYQFIPSQEVRVRQVKSMVLVLQPRQNGKSPLEIELWDRYGRWVSINPMWGETEIESPALYIFPAGDFYVYVRNPSSEPVTFDNLGFRITAELTTGATVTYGLQP